MTRKNQEIKHWSREEDDIVVEYCNKSLQETADALKEAGYERSHNSIMHRRHKWGVTGFSRGEYRFWTDLEKETIIKGEQYTARQLAEMLNRSESSIKTCRLKMRRSGELPPKKGAEFPS